MAADTAGFTRTHFPRGHRLEILLNNRSSRGLVKMKADMTWPKLGTFKKISGIIDPIE